MKCHAIISIGVDYGSGGQEIRISCQSTEDKYKGKAAIFTSFSHKDKLADSIANLFLINKDAILELVKEGKTFGLYWQVHGDYKGTDPPADTLAELTARMALDYGVYFRKINLSACESAGAPKDGKELNDSLLNSAVALFCKTLGSRLAGTEPLEKDGVMVAGYRGVIILHDANDPDKFFSKGKYADYKFLIDDHGKPGVRNTIQAKSNKTQVQTHPHLDAKTTSEVIEARKTVQQAGKKQKQQAQAAFNTKYGAMYDSIKNYIQSKIVLKYVGKGQWATASVAEYTNNADIATLVKFVESELIDDKKLVPVGIGLLKL